MAATLKRPASALEDAVRSGRDALAAELAAAAEALRGELAPWALGLTIGEFLLLESVMERVDALASSRFSSASTTSLACSASAGAATAALSVFVEPPPSRRTTRAMARKDSILSTAETEWHDATSRKSTLLVPPQTPRFHPGLPETPAAMRHAQRRRETAARGSVLSAVGRTSVRGSIVSSAPAGRRPSQRASVAPANLITVQLDSGATLDVDITQSPSKLAAGLGADAIREIRAKVAQYASQLRLFFAKLKA